VNLIENRNKSLLYNIRIFLPVFPPRTESATPAPLGKAIRTPTHKRFPSPRDFISDVGKLDELPHFVSKQVVNNLQKIKHHLFLNLY